MTEIPVYNIISIAALFVSVVMLLRAQFFIIASRHQLPKAHFYFFSIAISSGIFRILYSWQEIIYSTSFPALILFFIGSSIAFYLTAKIKKDSVYTMSNVANKMISEAERVVSRKFSSKNKESIVPYEQLEALSVGVHHVIEGIYILRHKTAYNGLFFTTVFPPGAKMSKQKHENCTEYCYVVEGEMVDYKTGIIYREGDLALYETGKWHEPRNNDPNNKLLLHVYFEKA